MEITPLVHTNVFAKQGRYIKQLPWKKLSNCHDLYVLMFATYGPINIG